MTSAASPVTPRDLREVIDGFRSAIQRLIRLGVTIRYAALPHEDLGEWVTATRTLTIRHDATISDQLRLALQCWVMLVDGLHATHGASIEPLLTIVPTPRPALDAAVTL